MPPKIIKTRICAVFLAFLIINSVVGFANAAQTQGACADGNFAVSIAAGDIHMVSANNNLVKDIAKQKWDKNNPGSFYCSSVLTKEIMKAQGIPDGNIQQYELRKGQIERGELKIGDNDWTVLMKDGQERYISKDGIDLSKTDKRLGKVKGIVTTKKNALGKYEITDMADKKEGENIIQNNVEIKGGDNVKILGKDYKSDGDFEVSFNKDENKIGFFSKAGKDITIEETTTKKDTTGQYGFKWAVERKETLKIQAKSGFAKLKDDGTIEKIYSDEPFRITDGFNTEALKGKNYVSLNGKGIDESNAVNIITDKSLLSQQELANKISSKVEVTGDVDVKLLDKYEIHTTGAEGNIYNLETNPVMDVPKGEISFNSKVIKDGRYFEKVAEIGRLSEQQAINPELTIVENGKKIFVDEKGNRIAIGKQGQVGTATVTKGSPWPWLIGGSAITLGIMAITKMFKKDKSKESSSLPEPTPPAYA
jgi:hypothetical protein